MMNLGLRKEEKKENKGGVSRALKDMVYGMALHGQVSALLRTRMYIEHLFMLMTLGDMLGFPLLPPYYSLRLLPYAVPNIKSWKARMFREHDFTDIITQ
jgi:hypothetical protein